MPPEGGQRPPSSASERSGASREVIFEFIPMGNSVKATAVDVLTGVEVSVVGPADPSSQRELERIALRKLLQRLVREGHAVAQTDTPSKAKPGGGIIV